MTPMETVSYLLVVAYLFSLFALSVVAAHEAKAPIFLFLRGERIQRATMILFALAFIGAALLPLARALFGHLIETDPIRESLDGVAGDLIGHGLIAIGACVAVVAQIQMGPSWRLGATADALGPLVETGPYAFSRNPALIGQALLLTGLFFVLPGLLPAAATGAFLIAAPLQIGVEERALAAAHGETWRSYAERVRRIL